MIYIYGNLKDKDISLVKATFKEFDLSIEEYTKSCRPSGEDVIITLDQEASKSLEEQGIGFFNWNLLFSILGPNDTSDSIKDKLSERIRILKEVMAVEKSPAAQELHGSIRVHDLAISSKFYCWLFGISPKEWTHRYVTFHRKDIGFNFVLLVADGKELHKDTLYHLGMGVSTKEKVIEFYHSAVINGFEVHNPPRTTWRGTPLHELWLKDPDGTLIEIYARLSPEELREMPADKEPIFLV